MRTLRLERHLEGVFSRVAWRELLGAVGFEAGPLARPLSESETDEVFLCRRPA